MPVIFIILILTAEIIVTCQIVSFILKIDAKVCALNKQITALTPKIETGLTSVRIVLNKIFLSINNFEQKLQSKKEQFKFKFVKNIITIALFLILNTNAKKVLSTIDLAFAIKDCVKYWAKKVV